jgi:hypothetical protein
MAMKLATPFNDAGQVPNTAQYGGVLNILSVNAFTTVRYTEAESI